MSIKNGKLKLGRVRPKLIGLFWHKGVTIYGAPRRVSMSELELKLAYDKDNFIELPAVWDGYKSTKDVVYVPIHDGDIPVNLTMCDVTGFRPMTNEEMLNSLKAGHRPAVMGQERLIQEVLNHSSEVRSTTMTPMYGKLYPDGNWDGDIVNMVLHNESKDPTLSAIPLKALQRKGDYSPFCYAVTHAKDKNYPIILSPEEDNTFLLRTATAYYINIGEGYILIDNRKYKFELEDLTLGLDMDGDWVSTHMLHSNSVCNANVRIGRCIYKEIKILGEL